MKLSKLLEKLDYSTIQGEENLIIECVAIDSRAIISNSLFICINGVESDGHKYIESAILNGATAVLIEKDVAIKNKEITIIKVENTRKALAFIASEFCGNPSKHMKTIGITGTNGKTSISYFIEDLLNYAGKEVGVIGTVGAKINNEPINISYYTSSTPDAIPLHQILAEMKEKGAKYVVMETTSHGLAQDRVEGIQFEVGVFTNLTQDHLDYHNTFENYLEAKKTLFRNSKTGVINVDDAAGFEMMNEVDGKVLTYGIDKTADLQAKNIIYGNRNVRYDLYYNKEKYQVIVPIPGRFTVYNSLAAIGALLLLNISIEVILEGLKSINGVPGRIERVETDWDFSVIIDYAHTPDGLENVINSVREFTENRVITVFGCGGDRDKTKRSIMGEISGNLSDFTIITSDNPRTEAADEIANQIVLGIDKVSNQYEVMLDRKKAIYKAIDLAKSGDTVIIAGKGHENYQIIGTEKNHFDDKEIAQQALEDLNN